MGELLMRICPPSKYDSAPYMTLCLIEADDGIGYYIQTSENIEEPRWIEMGEFLVVANRHLFNMGDQVERWMEDYHGEKEEK